MGEISARLIKDLWKSAFPDEGKRQILRHIAEQLPSAEHGKKRGLKILRAGRNSGLPVDIETAYPIVKLVSETRPVGSKARGFMREILAGDDLSPEERFLMSFEVAEQMKKQNSIGTTAVQNPSRVTNTSRANAPSGASANCQETMTGGDKKE